MPKSKTKTNGAAPKQAADKQWNRNENRQKAHALLMSKGYQMQTICDGPNSKLEFYAGPRGVVIVQTWLSGDGVNVFADWPLGTTWEQTELALEKPMSPASERELIEKIARMTPYSDGTPSSEGIAPDGEDAMRVLNHLINAARALPTQPATDNRLAEFGARALHILSYFDGADALRELTNEAITRGLGEETDGAFLGKVPAPEASAAQTRATVTVRLRRGSVEEPDSHDIPEGITLRVLDYDCDDGHDDAGTPCSVRTWEGGAL